MAKLEFGNGWEESQLAGGLWWMLSEGGGEDRRGTRREGVDLVEVPLN